MDLGQVFSHSDVHKNLLWRLFKKVDSGASPPEAFTHRSGGQGQESETDQLSGVPAHPWVGNSLRSPDPVASISALTLRTLLLLLRSDGEVSFS